jgi:lipopolysaccharide export system protein LptA
MIKRLLFLVACCQNLSAAPEPQTSIVADTLTCYQKDKYCQAEGNVVIERQGEKGRHVLTADRVVVYFKQPSAPQHGHSSKDTSPGEGLSPPKKGKFTLSSLKACGNVVFKDVDWSIQADEGTYDKQANMIHVKGHVRITKDAHTVTGEQGEINLKTQTYTLQSSRNQPVRALLDFGAAKRKKNKDPKP